MSSCWKMSLMAHNNFLWKIRHCEQQMNESKGNKSSSKLVSLGLLVMYRSRDCEEAESPLLMRGCYITRSLAALSCDLGLGLVTLLAEVTKVSERRLVLMGISGRSSAPHCVPQSRTFFCEKLMECQVY